MDDNRVVEKCKFAKKGADTHQRDLKRTKNSEVDD